MPENDFEKQVQRLFEELRIRPSEKVWPQVESRVKKDKNRRRFFLWLPAALVALIAGGYWIIQTDIAPATISGQPDPAEQNLYPTDNKTAVRAINSDGESNAGPANRDVLTDNAGVPVHAAPGETEKTTFEKPGGNVISEPGVAAASDKRQPKTPGVTPPQATARGLNNSGNKISEQHAAVDRLPVAAPERNEQPQPKDVAPAGLPVADGIYIPPKGSLQTIGSRSFPVLARQRSLNGFTGNAPMVKIPKPKVWEWGLSAGGGVSDMDKGSLSDVFSFDKRMESMDNVPQFDLNVSGGYYNSSLAPQANTLYAVAPPASPHKRGFSWYCGAFVKRKLNDRFSLSSGLQYHQYTTNRIVGDVQYQNNSMFGVSNASNNAVPRFSGTYQTGRKYTNRHHFIELPLGIDWRVLNSKFAPVYLHAGLQMSYLVATNALHYDIKSGVYYEDRDYFRKLQTGLYAGVSTRLFSKKPYAFNIGPVASYQLGNLTKTVVNTRQNLMFVGMNAQWVMGSR